MTGKLGLGLVRTSAAVFASLTALCCSAPVDAETLDQLYAMAKKEKTLVVWVAAPAARYESAARAFEQLFPGITVSLTGGFGNALNTSIEEQVRRKKVETDLVISRTIQDFIAWNRRGLLLLFEPDGFDMIDIQSKDKDGGWIAVNKWGALAK